MLSDKKYPAVCCHIQVKVFKVNFFLRSFTLSITLSGLTDGSDRTVMAPQLHKIYFCFLIWHTCSTSTSPSLDCIYIFKISTSYSTNAKVVLNERLFLNRPQKLFSVSWSAAGCRMTNTFSRLTYDHVFIWQEVTFMWWDIDSESEFRACDKEVLRRRKDLNVII